MLRVVAVIDAVEQDAAVAVAGAQTAVVEVEIAVRADQGHGVRPAQAKAVVPAPHSAHAAA